ncbi:MAG: DUF116 domain-containing protein [Bacillota bacterium]|nr:DUF116 domain-containing protein [Bacillota bacterium]
MPVRKRVFLGLVSGIILAGGAMAAAVWALARRGAWGQTLLIAGAWLGFMVAAATAAGVVAIALSVWRGRTVFLAPFIRLVLELMYPVTLRLGPLVGVPKERVQLSFVAVNNALANLGVRSPLQPREVLLLVPHCLQRAECPHRITVDARNCRRCGKCQIAAVVELAESRGVNLAVATGGGMARKLIHDLRPAAVIAVACERDLTSGLLETFPLPVFGIVNDRPCGYCVNTRVNLERVEAALDHFLGVSGPVGEEE